MSLGSFRGDCGPESMGTVELLLDLIPASQVGHSEELFGYGTVAERALSLRADRPESVFSEDALTVVGKQEFEERLGECLVPMSIDGAVDDGYGALDQQRGGGNHVRYGLSFLASEQQLVLVVDDCIAGLPFGEVRHALSSRLIHVDDVGLDPCQQVAHSREVWLVFVRLSSSQQRGTVDGVDIPASSARRLGIGVKHADAWSSQVGPVFD